LKPRVNKNSYSIGQASEKLAKNYLKKHHFKIVAQNYKTKLGEIDIIAEKNNTLICFEVKFREDANVLPYVISEKQKRRISKAFSLYIKYNKKYYMHYYRFDIILINAMHSVNHIENAWEA
jgi:putative endonuclease